MTPPPWPAPPPVQPHRRPAGVISALAVVLAVAALIVGIVALTKSEQSPKYTVAQRAAAKTQLCSRYELASDAVNRETNGSDAAFARIAATNGAVILEFAAANPALAIEYRDAALNLAKSYQTMTAAATKGSNSKQFQDSLETVDTGQRALKDLCGD